MKKAKDLRIERSLLIKDKRFIIGEDIIYNIFRWDKTTEKIIGTSLRYKKYPDYKFAIHYGNYDRIVITELSTGNAVNEITYVINKAFSDLCDRFKKIGIKGFNEAIIKKIAEHGIINDSVEYVNK